MCKKLFVRASRASNFRSVTRRPERPPSGTPTSRVLWLVAFAIGWTMTGYGGIAIGQVAGVDDSSDMADSSGDIKRVEAWVEDGNLNLTMTVYGVFAPSVQETPAGMSNRYYYHWLLDTDNNLASGFQNSEYEGNATNLQNPIGVDVVVMFGWRDGNTNGVEVYVALTEEILFEDYEYTIDGDTIHAVIPLVDLGLTPADVIAVSAFQEGASNDWQVDWIESAVLALTVTKATNPVPETESDDIPRDVILGWEPGASAATHDVYLGTTFDDVNDASRADPKGILLSESQADTAIDPGRLEFGQTYYWRVDEVNSAPDFTVFKGDVWSFTVEPFAYPIEGVIATSNGISEEGAGIDKTVDGSGLNAADEHSTEATDMWLALPGADPLYLQYEFDGVYKLHEVLLWNYNVPFELVLGFGIKDVTVEYSENGVDWTVLGDVELAQATALPDYIANTTIDFGGVAAKFVKLTVLSSYGTLPEPQYGLSEIHFMFIPTQAREPQPADDAADISVATALSWRAGREAASHAVYFATDPESLAPAGTTDAATFDPGVLDLETTYYWQVTEVNEAEAITAWAGAIWSFTTQAYLVVDDFESYTDDIEAGETIFQTWIDGYEMPGNGSTVGHLEAPFAERTIVNGGGQSMPLFYDNTEAATSEVEMDLVQDWTASGIKSLSLHFQGAEGNTGQLYVKINGAKVPYSGDASDIASDVWLPWNIDLSTVGGNLGNVSSLAIGVEGAGATGVVYLDDIWLCPDTP